MIPCIAYNWVFCPVYTRLKFNETESKCYKVFMIANLEEISEKNTVPPIK